MSKITGKTKMCMIIGDPVEHSLSPQMHNAAYKALGIDDEFVFTAANVRIEDVEKVVEGVRVLGIRGLTCTMPHKVEVMKYIDEIDPIAKQIGAVNTVVNDNGKLIGYNTDWYGVVEPISQMVGGDEEFKNNKFAILGAGGAAKAAAFGIVNKGGQVIIINRTLDKAKELAENINEYLGVEVGAYSTEEIERVVDCNVIFNGTPLGMGELIDQSPIPSEYLGKPDHKIIFDSIYHPKETRLIKEADRGGDFTIFGLEMLLYQGLKQFELYTGRKAPEKVMRKILSK